LVHPRGKFPLRVFSFRFRDRTAAAHCGHALVKPGAPIGAPSSEPLPAVHARTCRPAAPGHWLAPLRSPVAEIGHWWEPDKLMGYCVALYFAKLLVWDKVLGFGSTDALAGFAAITANLVVSFYFAKRGFENVARIIRR
jgi:hypothetical protein